MNFSCSENYPNPTYFYKCTFQTAKTRQMSFALQRSFKHIYFLTGFWLFTLLFQHSFSISFIQYFDKDLTDRRLSIVETKRKALLTYKTKKYFFTGVFSTSMKKRASCGSEDLPSEDDCSLASTTISLPHNINSK